MHFSLDKQTEKTVTMLAIQVQKLLMTLSMLVPSDDSGLQYDDARIMLWKSIYAPSINNKSLKHFYWTDRGRIDNTKPARYIICSKNISIRKRFVLACSVCFEVHEMWEEMSNEDRAHFYTQNCEKISPLLLFWAHSMEGSDIVLEQYMDGARKSAIEIGLLEAVKYLFAVSTEDERRTMASASIEE
ncbi:hypothetical protein AVEN_135106-1 [Araneus ventricosus]|uniref:Uncharacterized protein n=1 Tax=Araneus ventricosus TaxID=182803 RepID=A0A4Y2JM95_ARAVE|nr:hypothetical protein AVEN_135106-1 [Araneus ventricosus]